MQSKINLILFIGCLICLTACHDLDLNPLSSASTGNWYSSEKEIEMAVNDLYRAVFWPEDEEGNSDWSDDSFYRETLSAFQNATLNGLNGTVNDLWSLQYKVIARANAILENYQRAINNGGSQNTILQYVAEAKFHRACAYAKLLPKFGDIPLVKSGLTIEEAFAMGRTDKNIVKQFVYDDFDDAIEVLPTSYSGINRATKGAALALKARFALYMGDYEIAAEAAKSVIDLDIYHLHSNYSELFLSSTKNSEESIFLIPRSIEYGSTLYVKGKLPRNLGGYAAPVPTWDLFAAYTCTDGLPIDESPLFDPHEPFKNRDPRLSMTIVPFGENFLGVEYNPHPEVLKVMDYRKNKLIKNNDTRANNQYASYNGLIWKKGMDESCLENSYKIEPDQIIIRYADILLIYAEAKIELNEIDQSVLDAINEVRARAYGVTKEETQKYPAVTEKDQSKLRTILRMERRVEFAKEGLRYMDLMRWRIMDKVMSKKVYILLYPAKDLIEQVVDKGEWFWPFAPEIDEDGLADFTQMEKAGKVSVISQKKWDDRQYLWPIPSSEIQSNPNMKPNPGY